MMLWYHHMTCYKIYQIRQQTVGLPEARKQLEEATQKIYTTRKVTLALGACRTLSKCPIVLTHHRN